MSFVEMQIGFIKNKNHIYMARLSEEAEESRASDFHKYILGSVINVQSIMLLEDEFYSFLAMFGNALGVSRAVGLGLAPKEKIGD
ncbi:hypothetical protein YC2023_057543 [Brassica napus]